MLLTGARIVRAVFKKYATQLHWRLSWPDERQADNHPQAEELGDIGLHASILAFFEGLVRCLEVRAFL